MHAAQTLPREFIPNSAQLSVECDALLEKPNFFLLIFPLFLLSLRVNLLTLPKDNFGSCTSVLYASRLAEPETQQRNHG
jgi:hypothetical protein